MVGDTTAIRWEEAEVAVRGEWQRVKWRHLRNHKYLARGDEQLVRRREHGHLLLALPAASRWWRDGRRERPCVWYLVSWLGNPWRTDCRGPGLHAWPQAWVTGRAGHTSATVEDRRAR